VLRIFISLFTYLFILCTGYILRARSTSAPLWSRRGRRMGTLVQECHTRGTRIQSHLICTYKWTVLVQSFYFILFKWQQTLKISTITNYNKHLRPITIVRNIYTEELEEHSLDGWPKMNYLELVRASGGTLSRWSRLHLQLLTPTNPHWARVVCYGSFSLCVIHREGLCPSQQWGH
jgi:hypothetical protein